MHIRKVASSEVMLEAYNEARSKVSAARSERKRHQSIQARTPPLLLVSHIALWASDSV